jgi:hypothetical protein
MTGPASFLREGDRVRPIAEEEGGGSRRLPAADRLDLTTWKAPHSAGACLA